MKNKIAIYTIFLLLIISMASWGMIINLKSEKKIANIYQKGQLIKSIDLSEGEESYEFEIEGDNGSKNTIRVNDGGISIVCANCPDEICVSAGKIKDGVVPIVCLPNKLVIEIEGEQKEEFDNKTF